MIEKAAEMALIIAGLSRSVSRKEEKQYIESLIKNGVNEDFFTSHEQAFFKAVMALHLQKRSMSQLDLIQQANSTIPNDYWQTIKGLWEQPPELDPMGFIPALREARASRRVEKINNKISELLKDRPHDITKWLPQALSAMQKVVQDGTSYSPDPRDVYYKSTLPIPFAGTGFRVLDELMLGGYRYGGLGLWYGFTKSSKSTWMYSLLVRAAMSGLPTSFIRGERPENEVVFECLRGICGHLVPPELLADKTFSIVGPEADPQYKDDERAAIKDEALAMLSDCVTIHPLETASVEELEQIVAIYEPVLVIIDPAERLKLAKSSPIDAWKASQATAQAVLDLAGNQKHPCYVAVTMQLSPTQKLEWLENSDLREIKGYGTNTWPMKATELFIVDKHQTLPNTGYNIMRLRTRKDGEVHLPFTIRYDPKRGRYIDDSED